MKKFTNGLILVITASVFFALGLFVDNVLMPGDTTSDKVECVDNEIFTEFILQYNADFRFQKERTVFPLLYITTSESDPLRLDSFLIEKSQWIPLITLDSSNYLMFAMPASVSNTGQPSSCVMRLDVIGIENGDKAVFYFESVENKWFLTSFEDLSF
jgi:hypothetical protein